MQRTTNACETMKSGEQLYLSALVGLGLTIFVRRTCCSEQDLTRQVTLYKSQLRELRLSNETNQARLLDASSRADQDLVSRLGEADMVLADLERANSRVAAVEGRNVRPLDVCILTAGVLCPV